MHYHGNAQKVFIAIRYGLNPLSDKLVYWLNYVAKTTFEKICKPRSQAEILTENIQFFVNLLIDVIVGIIYKDSTIVATSPGGKKRKIKLVQKFSQKEQIY